MLAARDATTFARARVGAFARGALVRRALSALAMVALLVATARPSTAFAAFTPPPRPETNVLDTAGVLSPGDVRALDQYYARLRVASGFSIVAFVVGDLAGDDIDTAAYKAFNAWGVGDKGKDNGILLVVAPNARQMRIETGKGAGGALTDLQSNDILRQVIGPLLKQNQFRLALARGADAVARAAVENEGGDASRVTAAQGDETYAQPSDRARAPRAPEPASPMKVIAMVVGILGFIVLFAVSPGFRSMVFLLFAFGGGGGGGGRGSGGFGGGGGGGGFGGGSSGGGGSSDSY